MRVVAGGLAGLIVFMVDAVVTLVRFILYPSMAERATAHSFVAMSAYLFLFIAVGALAGYLWTLRIGVLRHAIIGALAGALVWSYLTVTWPLTARPSAVIPPQTSVFESVLIGAGGGALGGLLLFAIARIRSRPHDRG